ncbi:SMP-30/gluconolactonase/LRE family protein [Kitasatospora sp. NPDC006697]|uniref:SMP-30/gluconolactonase/LRE family protein n=1 Tax=Kitasatospora sp. NPDC006697 TaxID=3364020 RepID=UPI00367F8C02
MKIWHTAPEPLDHPALLLGEGPRWDAATGTLSLVGIEDRLFGTVRDGVCAFAAVPDTLGCAVPWQDGRWLGAWGTTVGGLTAEGADPVPFAQLPPDAAEFRANDGACDPAGRFLVGVMSRRAAEGLGGLWQVRPDGTHQQLLDAMTIPNGLGWSPDGSVFYVTDSGPGTITAYAYDPATGELGERRGVFRIDPRLGAPDGLAVDADGNLWTAVWDGGAVLRLAPDGGITGVLEFPFARPSACAFAGPELDELVVTSARVGLEQAELDRFPLSGRTLRMRVDARGLPATRFGAAG